MSLSAFKENFSCFLREPGFGDGTQDAHRTAQSGMRMPLSIPVQALVTGLASADRLPAEFNEFSVPTAFRERRQNLLQQHFGIPALAWASIDGDGFHELMSRPKRWFHIPDFAIP
jgi:hypothetical protein